MNSIINRINESISTFSENTALIYKGKTISYLELGRYIDAICNQIVEQCGKNTYGKSMLVYMSTSIESIIVQLAVIKCGAIYIPLEHHTPLYKIDIGKIDNIVCLITNNKDVVEYRDAKIIYVDKIDNYVDINSSYMFSEHEYSHCILTSGTTGEAKAVLLSQKAIINQIDAKISILELNQNSRVCLSMSTSFVASIWQILATIFVGGTLVILDDKTRKNPYMTFRMIQEYDVTIVCTIPSVLHAYLLIINNRKRKLALNNLRFIVLTGEMLNGMIVNKFYSEYSIALVNAYGLTECSDDIFHHLILSYTNEDIVPIGKPIQNINYSIIDQNGKEVKDGGKGELCISGICLAKGYVNDEMLTGEKFKRMDALGGMIGFCTGDVVSQSEDGTITCYGRKDNQLKIHGVRIEPEAIENICSWYPGINDTLVVKNEDGINSFLCLLYVTQQKQTINISLLKRYLQERLPDYMVPSVYIKTNHILYNEHGKKIRKVEVINRSGIDVCPGYKENS